MQLEEFHLGAAGPPLLPLPPVPTLTCMSPSDPRTFGALALEAIGVGHRYGDVVALDGVSLQVVRGECVALVGESGSGKTTLLRCFNRMVTPAEGEVRAGGRNLREMDPILLRRSTGYVPQNGGLMPHWTVLRNVGLIPRLLCLEDPDGLARTALDRVGLPPATFQGRWPRELSGGQRQRVAIARALASEPAAILMDEPFGALDAITRADLQDAFHALRGELGITAVLVTHDLREALALGDRVAVLREGRLEQEAPPGELLSHPAPGYVSRLLERAGVAEAAGGDRGGAP
jgi:osmoprotectant transport system ATP-binding protein